MDCNGLDCTRVALFVLLYTSCVNKAVINHGEGPLLHIGSARKAGKAIVRRRRSTFRSRLLVLCFRLAGCFCFCFRPCLAPRANGASGQAEDILVPVWGFPALRPAPVPRLADSFLVLLHFLPLRRLLMCGRSILSGAWIGLVASCKLQ